MLLKMVKGKLDNTNLILTKEELLKAVDLGSEFHG